MRVPRLKTEIWVQAYLRRCTTEGAFAVIAQKGDEDAGAVAIKIVLAPGRVKLFGQGIDHEGETVWVDMLTAQEKADENGVGLESDADRWIERQTNIDPDLWVIEVEDREGRPFL